ncbi:MAG: DUF4838 domain-containing protein, partial [Clostridia bacterium]|nr:DUF4838 domain-containing protein [Clostridia bacterium]
DYEILFRGLLECMRMMLAWGHEYRKDTSAFSFSINDNRKVCACSECQYILDDGFFGRDENKKERLNAGETGLNLYLANRAARDIVKYYPGRACSEEAIGEDDDGNIIGYGEPIFDEYPDMKIFTITYAHDMPNEKMLTDERYKDIIPEENLILMWCSQPCNNHFIGSHECGDQANTLGVYQKDATAGLTAWGEVVKASGAEMWYWYYPINYNTKICDTPNIFNIYYDFVYLVEEANITGICHEGMHGVQTVYVFENLKAHLSAMLMWSFEYDENGNLSYMSFDEFCDTIKEYLSIFYGDGYEEIFKYIEMQNEAGDENKVCFVNNCDYPGDMYSYDYIRDNYEEMRELLLVALEKAETDAQKQNVMYLIVGCDVLGLSACHKSWYLEGSDEQKELYTKLYTEMLDYMKENNIDPGVNCNIQEVELDLSKTPLVAFYRGGTWREALNDQWVKLPGYPSWGYA